MERGPMRHEDANEKLLELAYDELPPREAKAIEAHARECAGCGAELARIKGTRGVMARLAPEPAPEHGEALLLAAARQAAEQRGRRRRAPRWVWSGAIAAAAAVLVVVISSRLTGMSREPAALRDAPDAIAGGSGARELASAPAPADEREKVARAPEAEPPEKLAKAEDAAGFTQSGDQFAVPPAQRPAAAPASPPAERPATPGRKSAKDAEEELAFAPPPPAAEGRAAAPPAAAAERGAVPAAPAPAPAPARAKAAPGELAAGHGERERAQEPAEPSANAAPAGAAAAARADAPVARAEAKRAAPSAARPPAAGAAADDGAVVWERSFPGCAGESTRRVERDALGRVLVYARRGAVRGVPFEAVLSYGADGRLARVWYREGDGPAREVAGAAMRTALPAGIAEPERAEDVLAAAPRCSG
jgi:hypothetical protein